MEPNPIPAAVSSPPAVLSAGHPHQRCTAMHRLIRLLHAGWSGRWSVRISRASGVGRLRPARRGRRAVFQPRIVELDAPGVGPVAVLERPAAAQPPRCGIQQVLTSR